MKTVEEEDAYQTQMLARFDHERLLLKQGRFDEYTQLVEENYADPNTRHAKLCEMEWRRGNKLEALEQAVTRLRSGNYSIRHVFQAAKYTMNLQNLAAADYLNSDFVSKFDESSSLVLISYVYKSLNGQSPTREEETAAKMLLENQG